MNAPASIDLDDIRTFLPGIDEEEHAKRAKLRSYRNAANGLVNLTDSVTARSLAWLAVEYVTGSLYAPGAADALEELIEFTRRLLIVAQQAERIDEARFAE